MKLTYESIPNVQAVKMVSSNSTYGKGFWTGICTACANLCGTECKRLGMKINNAKTSATNELMAKAAAANADGIMEIRYQVSERTVFMYGIAYKETDGKATPAQPAPVAQPAPAVQPVPVAQPTPAVQPVPVAQPAPAVRPVFCTKCGKAVANGAKFCTACGAKRA